jgi:hypothetical protein
MNFVSTSLSIYYKIYYYLSSCQKLIFINIFYFDLGQGEDYIYKGKNIFKGLHQNDILGLSEKQTFIKQEVSGIFPKYYLLKVNQF